MSSRFDKWLTVGVMAGDVLLINLAFVISYWIRYELQWFRAVDPAYDVPLRSWLPFALVLTVLVLLACKTERLYDLRRGASWFDEVYIIISGTTTAIVVMIFIVFLYRPLFYSRLIFLYAAVLIVVNLSLGRLIKRAIVDRLWQQGIGVVRVLVVGAGELGRTIMRNIVAQPELGYRLVGFVDDSPQKGTTDIGRIKALGSTQNLPRLLKEHRVDEVIISLPMASHRQILGIMGQCERLNVRARIVPDVFQLSLSRVAIDDLGGIPLIGIKEVSLRGVNLAVKRLLDVSIAVLTLVLLWPVMLLIAVLIRLDSPGPALFKQTRVGRNGRRFTLYKFRSMRVGAEGEVEDLSDRNEAAGPIFKIRADPRRTPLGRILRRTSLDELPQLFNVLKGEMSLVGPRPPLPTEVAQYEEWQKKRLEALPGMTGLWQVMGRSEVSFEEMVMLDIYYLENWSLGLDLKILLKTIPAIVSGRGAY